jgi:prophage regulatory protein
MSQDFIMRMPELCETVGLSKSTIYNYIRAGHFPKPVCLGGPNCRAMGWKSRDVHRWMESRQSAGVV